METLLRSVTSLFVMAAVALVNAPGRLAGAEAAPAAGNQVPAPDWAKNLVIYEIATKGYTSPGGPESGTFNSLRKKIPYLKALGVTGVWLAGHSIAHSNHFYNVWTQYACYDPFKFDPSLGTAEEFKALVKELHKADIRVLLDVITHGVMNDSPLIKAHPDWFSGGSWGMTDYNWKAKNAQLDTWWVEGWVDLVTKYGVDGFRLDVDVYRVDLWKEIRLRCAKAKHPIVIFPEHPQMAAGITDFAQRYQGVSDAFNRSYLLTPLSKDLAGQILAAYGPNPTRPEGYLGSIQLSCHDNGWEGSPGDRNPYTAQGSRCLMGYAMLFAPGIPVFMGGEEFNCDYRPLPNLSPHLFGGKDEGKGRWLYGSWIDWAQLERPEKQAMLKDVSRMIAIRKRYADLLGAEPIAKVPNIAAILMEGEAAGNLPVPYMRWNDKMAVVVAANPGEKPVRIKLKVPVSKTGWTCDKIKVVDLWSDKARQVIPVSGGSREAVLDVEVAPDKTPGGGLAVLQILPVR